MDKTGSDQTGMIGTLLVQGVDQLTVVVDDRQVALVAVSVNIIAPDDAFDLTLVFRVLVQSIFQQLYLDGQLPVVF